MHIYKNILSVFKKFLDDSILPDTNLRKNYINRSNPPQNLQGSNVVIPISQMGRASHREII